MAFARPYGIAFDALPLAGDPSSVTSHTMRGIGRYVSGLLNALIDEQPEWSSAHLRPLIASGSTAPAAGRAVEVRRIGLRVQDFGWLTAWLAARAALRRQRVSLWHGFDPNAPLSPVSARRTVMTGYDLIPLHEPAAMAQIHKHRRAIYRRYLRTLREARLVIAISQTTADDLVRTLAIPRERIRIVYPAVVALAADVDGSALPEQPDLLFVGVPDPTKQPELAIAALAELRRRGLPLKLRFVGYQRPSDRARLDRLSAASGVSDQVEHLGRVDDERLARLYRDSILLAMSRIEGFGLPPAESLLSGGRVVAGSAPAYREVLGVAADYAASEAATAIADAYEAAASRPANGNPPAEMVERLSPRAVAASLIAAYEDALLPG
jgi:glycosyltransferase involved in cell wall biosynthesis